MNLLRIKYRLGILLGLLVSTSCTKVIELPLSNDTGKLVIEGTITNVAGPQSIKLSQNVPFYTSNIYPPVTGAVVSVSDQVGNNYPFIESSPGTYANNSLVGIAGSTYTMQVVSNGITYTASSTMPALVPLDRISSKKAVFDNTKRAITVSYQDPIGVPNQYRFVLRVNGQQVNSFFPGSDKFSDGKYVSDDLSQNDIDIRIGDEVTVEMHCIDKPMYRYWYALATQSANGPGGGVAPANPSNTISPATLGYFSAHTVQSKTAVVSY